MLLSTLQSQRVSILKHKIGAWRTRIGGAKSPDCEVQQVVQPGYIVFSAPKGLDNGYAIVRVHFHRRGSD